MNRKLAKAVDSDRIIFLEVVLRNSRIHSPSVAASCSEIPAF